MNEAQALAFDKTAESPVPKDSRLRQLLLEPAP